MNILPAFTPSDIAEVRLLFQEYFDFMLREQGIDMGYQGFQAELAGLPGAYAPPQGCLLLARVEDQAAGCIALRLIGEGIAELKRMYVRPQFRSMGIGRALCERLIQEARQRGYRFLRLDTADTLLEAQRLYLSLGFQVTEPYNVVPPELVKRAIYMEMKLSGRQMVNNRIS